MTDEEARPQVCEPTKTSADGLLLRGSPAQPVEELHPKLYEHWKEMGSEERGYERMFASRSSRVRPGSPHPWVRREIGP